MSQAELPRRITIDSEICHGRPCIRGMRYPFDLLLELHSGNMNEAQILVDYPDLEPADWEAVYAYAAKLSRGERVGSNAVREYPRY